jgi:putative hydrolase of HD superfamily
MIHERIEQQLRFLNEVEKLKVVYRQNKAVDRSRFENSAEHSWHVALMALVFAEHADEPNINLFKVVKLLLVHDLVEVYAGDTWIYDAIGTETQEGREREAAQKLFGLLPPDQAEEFKSLWLEFENRISPEAKYAASVDMLQPLANHLLSGAPSDEGPKPGVVSVLQRKAEIADASSPLWALAQRLIEQSAVKGLYARE